MTDYANNQVGQIMFSTAYAPLSHVEIIGMFVENARSGEWFERLENYLQQQDLPLSTVSILVKQLLPSKDRTKVDLAKDEADSIPSFVEALKKRLVRQGPVAKRLRQGLLHKERRSDESVEDFVSLIKADLKVLFPTLTENILTQLAMFKCWEKLPEEVAIRVPLQGNVSTKDWSARVEALFETPPQAIVSELRQMNVSAVTVPQSSSTSPSPQTNSNNQQDLDELKNQVAKLTELVMAGNNRGNGQQVFCNCGRPAKTSSVQRAGPNHGRRFFACAAPRDAGCNFFQWFEEPRRANNNWRNNSAQHGRNQRSSGNFNAQ